MAQQRPTVVVSATLTLSNSPICQLWQLIWLYILESSIHRYPIIIMIVRTHHIKFWFCLASLWVYLTTPTDSVSFPFPFFPFWIPYFLFIPGAIDVEHRDTTRVIIGLLRRSLPVIAACQSQYLLPIPKNGIGVVFVDSRFEAGIVSCILLVTLIKCHAVCLNVEEC